MGKRCGVYKYVCDGEIIYIGKSDHSIESRISGHSRESKFKPFLKKCKIYYAWLPNPAFTTIFETYLINKYKPILNAAMKYDKIIPFNISEPHWYEYNNKNGCVYHIGDEDKYLSSQIDELERAHNEEKILLAKQYNKHIDELKKNQNDMIDKIKSEFSLTCKKYEDEIHELKVLSELSASYKEQCDFHKEQEDFWYEQQQHYAKLYDECNEQRRECFYRYNDKANEVALLQMEVASLKQSNNEKDKEIAHLRAIKNDKPSTNKLKSKIKAMFLFT